MDTQFTSCLPKSILNGDKIELEGYFDKDAESFSLNLVCDRNESEQEEPNDVVYNYKLKFNEEGSSVATFRYKHGGVWQEPINEENLGISIDEKFKISLLLRCNSDEDSEGLSICTYYKDLRYDSFDLKLPIENAKYIEIWSGLKKIESIKFTFS